MKGTSEAAFESVIGTVCLDNGDRRGLIWWSIDLLGESRAALINATGQMIIEDMRT